MTKVARHIIPIFFVLPFSACVNTPHFAPRTTDFSMLSIPVSNASPSTNRRTRVLDHMLKLAQKPSYTARDINSVLATGPFSIQEGLSSLFAALDDPQDDVREDVRHLLWHLPTEFLPELVHLCPKHHRFFVAQIALARGAEALPVLSELMLWYDESDANTRLAIFNMVGNVANQPEVLDWMRRGLSDEDERIRLFAISFLIDDPDAASAINAVLSTLRFSQDPAVADCALFWLKYQKIQQSTQRILSR